MARALRRDRARVRAHDAVLDGELVYLDTNGRCNFDKLLRRRDRLCFYAFDLLSVDGEDLRACPLHERKRRLRAIMPRIDCRLLYVDDLRERGRPLFDAVLGRDIEGVSENGVTVGMRRTARRRPVGRVGQTVDALVGRAARAGAVAAAR